MNLYSCIVACLSVLCLTWIVYRIIKAIELSDIRDAQNPNKRGEIVEQLE